MKKVGKCRDEGDRREKRDVGEREKNCMIKKKLGEVGIEKSRKRVEQLVKRTKENRRGRLDYGSIRSERNQKGR